MISQFDEELINHPVASSVLKWPSLEQVRNGTDLSGGNEARVFAQPDWTSENALKLLLWPNWTSSSAVTGWLKLRAKRTDWHWTFREIKQMMTLQKWMGTTRSTGVDIIWNSPVHHAVSERIVGRYEMRRRQIDIELSEKLSRWWLHWNDFSGLNFLVVLLYYKETCWSGALVSPKEIIVWRSSRLKTFAGIVSTCVFVLSGTIQTIKLFLAS